MDRAFEAYFYLIKDALARDSIDIDVAFKPGGDVDYIYRRNLLLTLDDGDNVAKLQRSLRGVRPLADRGDGVLLPLSIEHVEGRPSVPEALAIIDRNHPRDAAAADEGALPLASPDHMVDVVRLCPATEPEVPPGNQPGPWPAARSMEGEPLRAVNLVVSDTGLLPGVDAHPWMAGVAGDEEALVERPGWPPLIPENAGHGSFVAGVARCLAPRADVFVANHFTAAGADVESRMAENLAALVQDRAPDIVNLSAGSYTRNDWRSLGFESFHRRAPGLTLVAAAGNDSSDRRFWPAACEWAVGVGALGADQEHRAWFSNYGDWVDVYALGEGVVNAYAIGDYVYRVPPKRPAVQTFDGLAMWSGTSFATPVVAGMIAAEMAATGGTSDEGRQAVLDRAAAVDGIGQVLRAG
jgi:subtilisin family serine protease